MYKEEIWEQREETVNVFTLKKAWEKYGEIFKKQAIYQVFEDSFKDIWQKFFSN